MMFVSACLLFAAVEWENPAVNSENRLPPRAYAMPLASERDALSDDLEPRSPYALSLNGDWKFSWAGNPDLRAKGFESVAFDDSDWLTIDVPSCVEMRGFGSPGYVNTRYPHADASHPTNANFAAIRDRQSGRADYNPVSSYRRTFTVPAAWKGRRVILRFDGVYSAYYVWVNGRRLGYAEDSMLPSEFDVTEHLKDGENLLCVEVYRWCDGSYLEDQDMTRFSGIFRDVTLWSMPKDGIWDFSVKTRPVDGYEKWALEVKVDGGKSKSKEDRISVSLYDAEHKKAGDLHSSTSTSDFNLILSPRLWSAEDPYLYTLVIRRGDDIRMKRVGFKEQKVVGHTFLVNGRAIKFKGVNRHETSPENGRTVTRDEMVRDIELMKRYNVDTVRTSHYPNHRLWYDLCDRYGLYVVAEANVEAHEPGYGEKGLGKYPEWNDSIVERNARHVVFYRNNPCVTMWSLGNETGHGLCFTNAAAEVRRLDSSRPVHWERGSCIADVDSRMYPSIDVLDGRGRFGMGADMPSPDRFEPWWNFPADARHTRGKCCFICEYAHAMGNALGNFQEYWDVFYKYESLCGGCIWDWADQAIWKYTDRVDPRTGERERYLAYGGDFDEQPNDGPFNCNGVIGPERKVTAKLIEVGHVHRNLVVTRTADGTWDLWNRYGFTRADAFDGVWELLEDGRVVRSGTFAVPHLAPLSHGAFVLPELQELALDPVKEHFVNFSFALKADTLWAKKGWVVARDQVALQAAPSFARAASVAKSAPAVAEDARTLTVTAGGTKAVFCRRSGTLCELVMNGTVILRDPAPGIVTGPQLTCERAYNDNDGWMLGSLSKLADPGEGTMLASGLTQLRYHVHPIAVKDGRVVIRTDVTGSKSAGFTHRAEWSFGADGAVAVRNEVTPFGTMPKALPRLGLSLKLDKALENVRYYGRGPYENYVDRKAGSFLGIWSTTVTGLYEDYVRPQDNGYRCDVRWTEFTGADGRGVRFSADRPLFVQALHYGREDLDLARHRRLQRRICAFPSPRPEVCLNLDVRQTGLGGASCGPEPLAEYVFPIEKTEWTLRLDPVVTREPLRVTLTFDDALKDHLLIAAPELEKRGWRGTFNLVTDWVGSKPKMMTWADARELVRRGHELTTHAKTHPNMLKLDEARIRAELALSRDEITAKTGFAPRYYCAPYLQQNEETARLARLEGLEQMPGPRHNYCAKSPSVRDQLLAAYERGVKRYDVLHHGICPVEAGGNGGWEPFADKAAFLAHLDAIAELEREGKIVVTDYDGFLSDCRLKAKAWPHHGVLALSFDDHNLADWETALPLFAQYGARTTFFLTGEIGPTELAFARTAMLAGHEVGLHGLRHRNADEYTAANGLAKYWADEVVPQLDACLKAGLRPRSFAYPNCRRSPETDELFRTNGFTRVRGLSDGIPCPTPHDPRNEKAALRHPVAESDSEFFPAADYLKVLRVRNVIMGSFYHTDIEDYVRAMRRAGERAEAISVVSHGIKPEPNGISMKTAWLERLLSEADGAGVVVRGVR